MTGDQVLDNEIMLQAYKLLELLMNIWKEIIKLENKLNKMVEYYEELIRNYRERMKQGEFDELDMMEYKRACDFLITLSIWGLYSHERLTSLMFVQ